MARVRTVSPAQRRHVAAARRDDALTRLWGITGGIGVAVVLAVGAIGLYVSKALPGHHAAPAPSSSTNPTGAGGGVGGNTGQSGAAASGSGSLNPPASAPQSAPLPAPVTSGST